MKDETLYDVLYDYQTRLQGVSNDLGVKLAAIMYATEGKVLAVLKKDVPKVARGLKTEVERVNKIVKKLEETRAPSYDAAQDLILSTCGTVVKNATKQTAVEALVSRSKALEEIERAQGLGKERRALREERFVKTLTPAQQKAIIEGQGIDGATIKEWFWRWKRQGLEELTALVRRASVESLTVAEIAKAARGTAENGFADGVFADIRVSAARLARTLINGVSNNARVETICENSDVIDGVKFIGTLDGKTCPHCAAYDGHIWRGDEMETARRPPIHPNCRCTLVPWVELKDAEGNPIEVDAERPAANADFDKLAEDAYNAKARSKGWSRRWDDLSPSTRLKYFYEAQKAYEKQTGEPAFRQVPGATTFAQYFQNQSDDFKRAWLGAKRFNLYKSGQLDEKHIFTPDLGYTVAPDSLVQFTRKFESERLTEIVRKYIENGADAKIDQLTKKDELQKIATSEPTLAALQIEWTTALLGTITPANIGNLLDVLSMEVDTIDEWNALNSDLDGTKKAWQDKTNEKSVKEEDFWSKDNYNAFIQVLSALRQEGADFFLKCKEKLDEFRKSAESIDFPFVNYEWEIDLAVFGKVTAKTTKGELEKLLFAADSDQLTNIFDKVIPTQSYKIADFYETLRPEKDGLFNPALFDQYEKDYEAKDQVIKTQLNDFYQDFNSVKNKLLDEETKVDNLPLPSATISVAGFSIDVSQDPMTFIFTKADFETHLQTLPPSDVAALNTVLATEILADITQKFPEPELYKYGDDVNSLQEAHVFRDENEYQKACDKYQEAKDLILANITEINDLINGAKAATQAATASSTTNIAAPTTAASFSPILPNRTGGQTAFPEPSDFPNSLDELKVVSKLGGSTGAQLVEDSKGNRYVMKKGASAEHLLSECEADAFYSAIGANVPDFKVYNKDSGAPVKLSRFLDGAKSLGDWWRDADAKERHAMEKELRKFFAVDVLLGNWDVVGMDADNIMVDANGQPWRIDNGGSLKYRAMGTKKTDDQWSATCFIDDLWTMTANGARIGANTSSTIPKYIGATDVLEIANEIETLRKTPECDRALAYLTDENYAAIIKRLEEVRQLAVRGNGCTDYGFTRDYALAILDESYKFSKQGVREACSFTCDLENYSFGWFRAGRFNSASLTQAQQGSELLKLFYCFNGFLRQEIGNYAIEEIEKRNNAQGKDSYSVKACRTKILRLRAQGFDIRDSRYQTFEDLYKDATAAGYYLGTPKSSHYKNIKKAYNAYKADETIYDQEYEDSLKYNAALQLALENSEFTGNDKSTRTVVLMRTEDDNVVTTTKPGEKSQHLRGVNESHSVFQTVVVGGDNLTMVRVPYSRINGFYMMQSGVKYDKPMYGSDAENEFSADTHGLPAYFMGKVGQREKVSKFMQDFSTYEREDP